jgi:hypothetical protein
VPRGPAGEYAVGGDPFQGQPAVVNKDAYLAGGTSQLFGPVFIPRNLTPDTTGRPEGGASYEEFLNILRTGVDPDHAHPQFGPFLQVMPWPTFHNMTDHDIRAIYEYLSAIPASKAIPDSRTRGQSAPAANDAQRTRRRRSIIGLSVAGM